MRVGHFHTVDPWAEHVWKDVPAQPIANFHPQSSDHRPATRVHVLHDGSAIYLRYDIDDRYVLSRETKNQALVCFDSCVEFFVQPTPSSGYFNFEFNAGGTIHCHYIEDPMRTPAGFVKDRPLTDEQIERVTVRSSLPRIVWPERTEPTPWRFDVRIPVSVMEDYIGALSPLGGRKMQGNFYKCADKSSHPHWASWSPIGEQLNFHRPETFGTLLFE
jgi:hypothetical protein